MRWLVFGSYDVRRHPRVGVLIQGLRAAGDEVVELNAPLALDTAARVAVLRQPWRLPVLGAKMARCWALLALGARRHRAPRNGRREGSGEPFDAVLVGYLGHFDIRLARWLFRRTPIVLDHLVSAAGTASDRRLAGGLRGRLMRAIDAAALRRADVVVVDTAAHLAALPAGARDRGVVAAVGAGTEWFAVATTARPGPVSAGLEPVSAGLEPVSAGPGPVSAGPGPVSAGPGPVSARRPLRVVFVGLFTPLHGTVTLGGALARLAADEEIEVTMVGTGQDYPACRAAAAENPRVTWHDWVPAAELPTFVAAHDVSLGIFGTTGKARRVVPTKVFQGAAAGCAIVTSDTAPQRQALGTAALYVPPGDAGALAAALHALATDPDRLARLRRAARRRADEMFRPATVVEPIRLRFRAVAQAGAVAREPVR